MIATLLLPDVVESESGEIQVRRATRDDLDAVVNLLRDDAVSSARADGTHTATRHVYERAFEEIAEDARNDLLVAVDPDGEIVGTLQLTSLPGMSRGGATRLQVEAVRVSPDRRSSGIGSALMGWLTGIAAPAVGARLVQLTSDMSRTDARRFYLRLGFADSHVGFKYFVTSSG